MLNEAAALWDQAGTVIATGSGNSVTVFGVSSNIRVSSNA